MLDADRLRSRIEEIGLSQSKLGERVGVSSSAINRMVHGGNYGTKYLHLIARELRTTPAYLTGETDDPEADAPDAPEYDPDTRWIIEKFTQLTPTQRKLIHNLADELIGPRPSGTVHAPKPGYGAPPTDGGRKRAAR